MESESVLSKKYSELQSSTSLILSAKFDPIVKKKIIEFVYDNGGFTGGRIIYFQVIRRFLASLVS